MHLQSSHEEDIFLSALELLDPVERNNYLDASCGSNPDLRAAVEAMITDHEHASTLFMEVSAAITLEEIGGANSPALHDLTADVGKLSAPTPSPARSAKEAVA